MARYSAFLGRWVEVHYRAGDILLPASGTFVADSGKSIFLEQHLEQRGQKKQFRWEIPYQYIVRLEEPEVPTSSLTPPPIAKAAAKSGGESSAAPRNAGDTPSPILPLQKWTKPA
jgi:hypothetical protein